MKPIGYWYVCKERRGLVRLVIDNRHALERLKRHEAQASQVDLDSIEEEHLITFADFLLLSASDYTRGQSSKRDSVVAAPQSNGSPRRFQESETPSTHAGPSAIHDDIVFLPSLPREIRRRMDPSIDSDAESIGQSSSSRSRRQSIASPRLVKEQATSQLLFDLIPHDKADEKFKGAQNTSWSTLLEAKAEETIDTLLRQWTYVDPSYFPEDDRSSILSNESSLPSSLAKIHQHAHEEQTHKPARCLSVPYGDARGGRPGDTEDDFPAKELASSQSVSSEKLPHTPPASSPGRIQNAKKRPSPLRPTVENLEEVREEKTGSISCMPSDQGVHSPKEPSTPAPPYPSSHSSQCSSCYGAAPSPFTSRADRYPHLPLDAQARDKEMGDETTSALDSVLRLFENRILEMTKQPSLENGLLDSRSCRMTEQRGHCQQAVLVEQEAEPVILKDCLGRKFLFPIDKCRSWQVSAPRAD